MKQITEILSGFQPIFLGTNNEKSTLQAFCQSQFIPHWSPPIDLCNVS